MIEWMEDYATGVQLVDIQHRALFQQINRLEAMIKAAEIDPYEVERLLVFLSNYIVGHFRFEENCMKRRFSADNPNREVLQELLEHTQAWIKDHILKIDQQLKNTVSRPGF